MATDSHAVSVREPRHSAMAVRTANTKIPAKLIAIPKVRQDEPVVATSAFALPRNSWLVYSGRFNVTQSAGGLASPSQPLIQGDDSHCAMMRRLSHGRKSSICRT